MTGQTPATPHLKRSIGPLQLFSMAFASMIGVGWITLLGFWLERAGPAGAILGFTAGAVVVLLIVLSYAEVSSLYPVAGAEVAYAQVTFGSRGAFPVAWMLLFLYLNVICFEIISAGWITTVVAPALKGPRLYSLLGAQVHLGEVLIGLALTGLIAWANVVGAAMAARVQTVLMAVKIVISLLFIGAGFLHGDAANLQPLFALAAPDDFSGVFAIFSMALLFYGGFNYLPQALEERRADVTAGQVCLAMVLSVLGAFAFYAAVILSASLALPRADILAADLPTAAAFQAVFGSVWMRNLVLLAGLLGIVTAMNGTVFAASRILLLMSRTQLLPPVFGRLSPRWGTPATGVLIISAVGMLGALCGKGAIGVLVNAGGAAVPFAWAIVCVIALKLRFTAPETPRPYRTPLGPVVFVLAFVGAVFSMGVAIKDAFGRPGGATSPEAMTIVAVVLLGALVWGLGGRRRRAMSEAERRDLILQTR